MWPQPFSSWPVGTITASTGEEVSAAGVREKMDPSKAPADHLGLSPEEKRVLLNIARSAIEKRLSGGRTQMPQVTSRTLQEKRGVFVTLHKEGALRGCIGYIKGFKPLHQAVGEMAVSAAFGDPRFPPVLTEELADLEVEISVLTPLHRVDDVSEIRIGEHGLFIVRGHQSGLLLPQVASEYGWDRETFLQQTCLKAGLPKQAWRDAETEIYSFGADVFSQKEVSSR
jgi:AmmeMemoRadiSam system protein A